MPEAVFLICIKDSVFIDPEFGLMDRLYSKAKIQSYLELFVD